MPYPGGAPMLTDLISGRIQAGVDALPNSLPHIRSGAVRALAVMSPERNPALPDVPTIERDHPGPRGQRLDRHRRARKARRAEIVERLNRDINAGLADANPEASAIADVGAVPIILTPAEARRA